ncbi:MAG: hypothetical protein ACYTFA_17475, partial [Planctomycetota bacterium]
RMWLTITQPAHRRRAAPWRAHRRNRLCCSRKNIHKRILGRLLDDSPELDPVSRAIIGVMDGAGISVEITGDPECVTITARTEDGHTHVYRGADRCP